MHGICPCKRNVDWSRGFEGHARSVYKYRLLHVLQLSTLTCHIRKYTLKKAKIIEKGQKMAEKPRNEELDTGDIGDFNIQMDNEKYYVN